VSQLLARFWKDQSAATAIEYGLIAAGIAVAIIRHAIEHHVFEHLDATQVRRRAKWLVLGCFGVQPYVFVDASSARRHRRAQSVHRRVAARHGWRGGSELG